MQFSLSRQQHGRYTYCSLSNAVQQHALRQCVLLTGTHVVYQQCVYNRICSMHYYSMPCTCGVCCTVYLHHCTITHCNAPYAHVALMWHCYALQHAMYQQRVLCYHVHHIAAWHKPAACLARPATCTAAHHVRVKACHALPGQDALQHDIQQHARYHLQRIMHCSTLCACSVSCAT
jgi:hypothetical protein